MTQPVSQATDGRTSAALPLLSEADVTQLAHLLQDWETARRQGKPLTAAELTVEVPQLLPYVDDALRTQRLTHELLVGSPAVSAAPPGYRILHELGRGGMGVVYRAEQMALNRVVALKMVLAGANARPEQLARFLGEAELLAKLAHPHIVSIYDYGTHAGLPYIALEFCPGGSLEKRLRDQPQAPRATAELMVQLADALGTVHALGIIHRDLKPENVLLTAAGVPKVTDFGLARQGQADLTRTGVAVGTPAYMAPEQALGDRHGQTPATDLWALGAILYQMLTGRVPFQAPSVIETMQMIVENDPVPLRQLVPGCPRDLETITHKCLHKVPSKRYASAADLRADLQAWLDGRPIAARPVGGLERALKWTRRNPTAATLLGVLLLGTLTLAGLTAWAFEQKRLADANAATAFAHEQQAEAHARQAQANEQRAEANERQAHANAQQADANALAARSETQRAERLANLAAQVLDQLTNAEQEAEWLQAAKLTDAEKRKLRTALVFYQELAQQTGNTSAARQRQADGYGRVATLQLRLGLLPEARQNFETERALRRQLVADQPLLPSYRADLASAQQNLANVYCALGRVTDGAMEYGTARDLLFQLVAEQPGEPTYRFQLARAHTSLGHLWRTVGRHSEAEAAFQAARDLQIKLLAEQPERVELRVLLAANRNNLAVLYADLSRWAEAITEHHAARALQVQLVTDQPQVAEYRNYLARTYHNLGVIYRNQQRWNDAEGEFRLARALQMKLRAEQPGLPEHTSHLARTHTSLGVLYLDQRRWGEAEGELRTARAFVAQLVADQPAIPDYRNRLAAIHNNLGLLYRENHRLAESEAEYRAARDLWAKLALEAPENLTYRIELSQMHYELGRLYQDLRRPAEADAAFRAAMDLQAQLRAEQPAQLDHALRLSLSQSDRGFFLLTTERWTDAHTQLTQAIETLTGVLQQQSDFAPAQLVLRNMHKGRAEALGQLRRHAEAAADWQRAGELDTGTERLWFRRQEADAWARAGQIDRALSLVDAVRKTWFLPAEARYDLARILALCAATKKDDALAARAVAQLEQAWATGFRNLPHIEQDADLAHLRLRADYQAFIARVKPTWREPLRGRPRAE